MKKLLISFACMLGLAGCGTYSQSLQVDDNAYLLITSQQFQNKILLINDEQEISLGGQVKKFDLNGKNAVKIQIPAGKHNMKIIEDNTVIVDRDFYVSTGTSFEVAL